MTSFSNELSLNDLDGASGGMRSLVNDPGYHGPTLNKGGTVGGLNAVLAFRS